MKIILAGGTGFIGSEILAQCRRKVSITSIVVLTRRTSPEDVSDDPKVESIIFDDFLKYPDDARNKMAGASAAIWALRAASHEQSFRYMHVSGVLAEKGQKKPLWFMQEGRRVKGLAKIRVTELSQKEFQVGPWVMYVARPSMVLPNPPGILNSLGGQALGAIRVDQLAAAMIDIVENGGSQETFESADLFKHAIRVISI